MIHHDNTVRKAAKDRRTHRFRSSYFKGFDPSIPLAEIICPVHGSVGTWKVDGYDPEGSLEGRDSIRSTEISI